MLEWPTGLAKLCNLTLYSFCLTPETFKTLQYRFCSQTVILLTNSADILRNN